MHPMKDNMIIGRDGRAMAKALNELTEERERDMVERAYQWAREQTWQKLADEYEDLWR
jgi:glycosyltransferase involved in cell wall biosynthesis